MPTGITSTLHDGEQNFRDYALTCARQFMPLFHLRATTDAPIDPDVQPDSWHRQRLEETRHRLTAVLRWTPAEAAADAQLAYQQAHDSWTEAKAKAAAIVARYETMLEQVRAWDPPTEEHAKLREFMEQQLVESIRFDSIDDEHWPEPQPADPAAHYQEVVRKLRREVEYHSEHDARAVTNATFSSAWIRALLGSLPEPEVHG